MFLAIDAGNTRTKWAMFDAQGEITQAGACINAALKNLSLPLEIVSSVLISNVAGEAHARTIHNILSDHHVHIDWLKSSAECCNILNHYARPETLGTDRWASLIAAWQMQHMTCVVVNAGTAVTIDALVKLQNHHNQADFIGGMILPGLNLMQSNLGHSTAQLQHNDTNANISGSILNLNTADAMQNGALNAICGAIQNMLTAIQKRYQTAAHVIISGGDANVIAKYLCTTVTNQVQFVDNLVLKGLYCIYSAQNKPSDKS